ncbi:DUF3817 domain-containing protein [Acinetobacter stercoris]|uniref:DUF3817 domain-containing protein n=1 Tax=Acinetobacter stercoris TaxID=2126983 RepID=A0A2U3MWE4_9GAMM|nr:MULTISPECIES: DUF3817 domain-containing protein [Acinetobacter]SPL69741.1 hypothetical protein KPC_0919 [Acinetobacter stercoris]
MNIKTLRIVGFFEGISFLLLLFIAMPLKYIWDNPLWVKHIGMGHGILFVLFIIILVAVVQSQKWSANMLFWGLIASVLPFGPFIYDRKLKALENS